MAEGPICEVPTLSEGPNESFDPFLLSNALNFENS
jgi:hypothetical protein